MPITSWLIRWAGMLLSRFKVDADGKTGFEKRVQRFVDIAREAGETGDTRIMDETSFRTLVKFNSRSITIASRE